MGKLMGYVRKSFQGREERDKHFGKDDHRLGDYTVQWSKPGGPRFFRLQDLFHQPPGRTSHGGKSG